MGKTCRKDYAIGPYLKGEKLVKDIFLYLQPQILNPFGFILNRNKKGEKTMRLTSGSKMHHLIKKKNCLHVVLVPVPNQIISYYLGWSIVEITMRHCPINTQAV